MISVLALEDISESLESLEWCWRAGACSGIRQSLKVLRRCSLAFRP